MTRDYARKKRPAPKRTQARSQVPAWVWLFIGTALGAFIVFLFYLWGLKPTTEVVSSVPVAPKHSVQHKSEQHKTLPKPRFDFYKLLQESEEIVPATEPSKDTTAQHAASNRQTAPAEYLLQVGSFRKASDADNLRAQLIMLNLNAHIEKVAIRDGEQWHRVVVGPFAQQSKLSKARSKLVSNQYNALVLKRKAEH